MRHGGDLTGAIARYGIARDDWLDLSTGINPYAHPCQVDETAAQVRHLPGPDRLDRLLDSARTYYAVPEHAAICAAPGTEILIRMQARMIEGPTALLPTSYRSYREAWAAAGCELREFADRDIGSLEGACNIALVNPNNPDGRVIDPLTAIGWARSRAGPGHLIADEAFADTEPDCSIVPSLGDGDPVIVFRSFGKFFGLPGLRLGFAIGPPRLVEPLRSMLGDWPVSAIALEVGVLALGDRTWQAEMRRRLAAEASALDAMLHAAGLTTVGGTSLFRLVRHPEAAAIHEHLARSGIWVRRFDEEPQHLRFGLPGSAAAAKRLQTALSGVAG